MEVIPCFCCVFAATIIGGLLAFYPLIMHKFGKKPPANGGNDPKAPA